MIVRGLRIRQTIPLRGLPVVVHMVYQQQATCFFRFLPHRFTVFSPFCFGLPQGDGLDHDGICRCDFAVAIDVGDCFLNRGRGQFAQRRSFRHHRVCRCMFPIQVRIPLQRHCDGCSHLPFSDSLGCRISAWTGAGLSRSLSSGRAGFRGAGLSGVPFCRCLVTSRRFRYDSS